MSLVGILRPNDRGPSQRADDMQCPRARRAVQDDNELVLVSSPAPQGALLQARVVDRLLRSSTQRQEIAAGTDRIDDAFRADARGLACTDTPLFSMHPERRRARWSRLSGNQPAQVTHDYFAFL